MVACVDINAETCAATVQRAQQLHGVCRHYQCDVRNKDMVCTDIFPILKSPYNHINL